MPMGPFGFGGIRFFFGLGYTFFFFLPEFLSVFRKKLARISTDFEVVHFSEGTVTTPFLPSHTPVIIRKIKVQGVLLFMNLCPTWSLNCGAICFQSH